MFNKSANEQAEVRSETGRNISSSRPLGKSLLLAASLGLYPLGGEVGALFLRRGLFRPFGYLPFGLCLNLLGSTLAGKRVVADRRTDRLLDPPDHFS